MPLIFAIDWFAHGYMLELISIMVYQPITEEKKLEWIAWLQDQVRILDGRNEDKGQDEIFKTGNGDVATGKDLVGNLLATLSNKTITIN